LLLKNYKILLVFLGLNANLTESITKEDILKGDIPRTPFLAFIVPFGKTIHDAETFYVVNRC
jgi:hypothetical protein